MTENSGALSPSGHEASWWHAYAQPECNTLIPTTLIPTIGRYYGHVR
ncbi:MAG: hypothetical protein WBO08_04475 [Mycobacterium sp.]|nr:hypothetical protein [Mycobacterium sp.]